MLMYAAPAVTGDEPREASRVNDPTHLPTLHVTRVLSSFGRRLKSLNKRMLV